MKKSLLLLAGAICTSSIFAQNDETSKCNSYKFTDNWSIGVNFGGTTPLTHSAFFSNMRPTVGLNINKQFSPIYGLTLESMYGINTTGAPQAFDAFDLMMLNRVNLNNVFRPYKGKPSLFEVEAVAGFGWIKIFDYYRTSTGAANANHLGAKAGVNFNFNLGEAKAWTLGIKPAIVWDMDAAENAHRAKTFHANYAAWEISAGITYHFKNSNGKHYMTTGCNYADKVAALNATISSLESEAASKNRELENAHRTNDKLRKDLKDCERSKKHQTATKNEQSDYIITFRQGKSNIENVQMPYIESLANYLNENKNAKVEISGYASPEGDKNFNQRLSQKRADAVKNVLVKKYNIDADRITSQGKGIGSKYDEPSWNRVSICVVK